MHEPSTEPTEAPMWRRVAWILIIAALASMAGRVLSVRSASGKTPFLSANDRSRWSTIRALVDHGTFSLDAVILRPDGRFDKEWQTIDLVRHRGPEGREHYYSSKPPLLTTMIAGVYWLLRAPNGQSIADEPFYYGRSILLIVNVAPMLLYFWVLLGLVERYGRTDWGRLLVIAAAAFGTFLTTFSVTLNNHLPAALSVLLALWAAAPVWEGSNRSWGRFALAGLFSAFAAANDLPALSFTALLGVAMFWKSPSRTLLAFMPGALVVAAAFWITNSIAHASWRPPYAHRQDGPAVITLGDAALREEELTAGVPGALRQALIENRIAGAESATLSPTPLPARFVINIPQPAQRFALAKADGHWEVREWDNWYEFPGSYWTYAARKGVDRGEPSRAVYALNVLIGHHGIFSLTPLWLLTLLGAGLALTGGSRRLRDLALMTLVLSAVCVGFYIARGQIDRNYGGVTSGFRWAFWLIPLWLLTMAPAADALAHHPWGRRLGLALLFVSALSAAYSWSNPWTHPWIYEYWSYLGWIER